MLGGSFYERNFFADLRLIMVMFGQNIRTRRQPQLEASILKTTECKCKLQAQVL